MAMYVYYPEDRILCMTLSAVEVSAAQVAARTGESDVFLLDVRRERDYETWHIEGTHNLPIYDQLLKKEFSGLEAALSEIPLDETIYVVCVAGITSSRAAEYLRRHGYDAASMTDGMFGWGRLHQTYDVPGTEGIIQVLRPGTGCLSYVVHDDGEAVVVDPSLYTAEYLDVARENGLEIVGVVDTHAHADHVSGGRALATELGVPYFLHEADSGRLARYVAIDEGDAIAVGERTLGVMHTPGHTPGSVVLRFGDALLSGDTLFVRSVGRPDLEDESERAVRAAAEDLFTSLERLADLPDGTTVLPGHFSTETMRPLATDLGTVADVNELFGTRDREAFVETIVRSLSTKPANYQRIKKVNWGLEPLSEETAALEFGPNNCAAN